MAMWSTQVVDRTIAALTPLADPVRASAMQAYMKGIAPFLGVYAQPRRRALRPAWSSLPTPASDDVGAAAKKLMDLEEREFHYAAYDLIDRYCDDLDEEFCSRHVERLLTTKPWWDTVDGLVNAAVSPLCHRSGLGALVDAWSESGDRWLIRAAIGHQRGWKADTDVRQVVDLCDRHWSDSEFFVAKAIGWALRDLARMEPDAVESFLAARVSRNAVAEREARRGLETRKATEDGSSGSG